MQRNKNIPHDFRQTNNLILMMMTPWLGNSWNLKIPPFSSFREILFVCLFFPTKFNNNLKNKGLKQKNELFLKYIWKIERSKNFTISFVCLKTLNTDRLKKTFQIGPVSLAQWFMLCDLVLNSILSVGGSIPPNLNKQKQNQKTGRRAQTTELGRLCLLFSYEKIRNMIWTHFTQTQFNNIQHAKK
jgi:hypothetical protein